MNKYKVVISADAMQDMRDIYSYVALTLQAKQAAQNLLNRIRKAIHDLEIFPNRYKIVRWEPWASMNVRQLPVNNYEIFYTVDEENLTLSVIRIFYGGRDIEHIISDTENR